MDVFNISQLSENNIWIHKKSDLLMPDNIWMIMIKVKIKSSLKDTCAFFCGGWGGYKFVRQTRLW